MACGNSDFSIESARYADTVLGIDISLERMRDQDFEAIQDNVDFREMDAANLELDSDSFDTVACFNGIGHMSTILHEVLDEMIRVMKPDGNIIIIATWKLDKFEFPKIIEYINGKEELEIEEVEDKKFSALVISRQK